MEAVDKLRKSIQDNPNLQVARLRDGDVVMVESLPDPAWQRHYTASVTKTPNYDAPFFFGRITVDREPIDVAARMASPDFSQRTRFLVTPEPESMTSTVTVSGSEHLLPDTPELVYGNAQVGVEMMADFLNCTREERLEFEPRVFDHLGLSSVVDTMRGAGKEGLAQLLEQIAETRDVVGVGMPKSLRPEEGIWFLKQVLDLKVREMVVE